VINAARIIQGLENSSKLGVHTSFTPENAETLLKEIVRLYNVEGEAPLQENEERFTTEEAQAMIENLKKSPENPDAIRYNSFDMSPQHVLAVLDEIKQLRARVAELETDTHWIYVKDRLPEVVINEHGYINNVLVAWVPAMLAKYIPNPSTSNTAYVVEHSDRIICWREIPALPPEVQTRIDNYKHSDCEDGDWNE
jgi:hypothetical protein